MPNVDLNDLTALFAKLIAPAGLAQLGALAAALLLAWLVARALRAKIPDQHVPGLAKIGAGSAHRIVFPLALLIFAWCARFALAKWQAVPMLNIAIPLIASFTAIRLGVYLLRHLFAPSSLLKASERIIVYSVWLVFALHITGLLDEITAALHDVNIVLGQKKVSLLLILQALLSVAATIFIALGISSVLEQRLMKADTIDMSVRVVIGKVVRALALVLAVLIALPLVGIDLTLLSVFGGALGVGLGLGLQKIASNYASGFIILLDRSIRIGDLVTVDNRHGVIEAIRARYTVIKSLDGTEVIVPNDSLITNTVINHSFTDPKVSMKTPVTIGYDSNLDRAREIMESVARAQSRVLEDPAPAVFVKALGDNGIDMELTVWIKDADQGQASLRSDILVALWREFQKEGISVPFPQREVRVLDGTAASISSVVQKDVAGPESR